MTKRPLIVAIDGPAGAGKSAAARELARRLGLPYLDTGAMYRAVALLASRQGLSHPFDAVAEVKLQRLAAALDLSFSGSPLAQRITVGGEDVTEALRTPAVSRLASQVSAVEPVRRELVARQREIAARSGGVVEGRDIGTVVFPDAQCKFFVTASPEVRARRRYDELRARGVTTGWEDVVAEQRERDLRDSSREHSPMVPAVDAVIVDTSSLTLEQVVDDLVDRVRANLDSTRRRSL